MWRDKNITEAVSVDFAAIKWSDQKKRKNYKPLLGLRNQFTDSRAVTHVRWLTCSKNVKIIFWNNISFRFRRILQHDRSTELNCPNFGLTESMAGVKSLTNEVNEKYSLSFFSLRFQKEKRTTYLCWKCFLYVYYVKKLFSLNCCKQCNRRKTCEL